MSRARQLAILTGGLFILAALASALALHQRCQRLGGTYSWLDGACSADTPRPIHLERDLRRT